MELSINEKATASQCNYLLRQETIVHYMPMAKRIAKAKASELFPEEDLEQIAIIAIIDAIDGYGYDKSSHIGSIAINAAKSAIDSYIKRETSKYYDNICELKNAFEIESEYNDNYAEFNVLKDIIHKLLKTLNRREEIAIVCIDLLDFTLKETSPFLGYICNQNVRRIRSDALRKLRRPFIAIRIKSWLDDI